MHLATTVTVCFLAPIFDKASEFLHLIALNDMIVMNDEVGKKCTVPVKWCTVLGLKLSFLCAYDLISLNPFV
jgi:hypothetical protein